MEELELITMERGIGMTMGQIFWAPAPNGTEFKFNKRVWDGYEIFFLNPRRVEYCPILPRPNYI